ncbi:phage tail protein [Altererythrobacter sp. H2]|uniref:GTA baseplate fiber-binding domain-containing protein n=1 Tax=Altererythrobacter sp. H2 TaxID=3108391 RepID=UPI002B4BE5D1|nr:phage tail protein [Altererythrobacter sp. H2]WRK96328.1 phage tail protein [Altererythrobacter sp. H2]
MATLVLGALGTLIGGPLGGAIGALAGRQLDSALIGRSSREGPRLKDLAISTSSYGQPIARVFGMARVAGTIIWATDLVERGASSGGGKGKPSVTSYSYSTSFAVALSSRPIERVGRIWADGQLIRGASGELKTGGTLRVHQGHPDQQPDPLLASALGPSCPAFRGCAYVVFEDLQLADFGNRIPALSFEVFADGEPLSLEGLLSPAGRQIEADRPLDGLRGFEQTSGSLREAASLIDLLYPSVTDAASDRLLVKPAAPSSLPALLLPPPTGAPDEDGFGQRSGRATSHSTARAQAVEAIRYYDPARDFQPGVQRLEGGAGTGGETLEFPAVFDAPVARHLLRSAWVRATSQSTRLRWRMAEIDPLIGPGQLVAVPGRAGKWMITDWEWREGGIELTLERTRAAILDQVASDPGHFILPPDLDPAPTRLWAFELPLDGTGTPDQPRRYLAASAASAGWSGAELLVDQAGGLVPVGTSGRSRAIAGVTTTPLAGSPGLMLDYGASLEVELIAPDMVLEPASVRALAHGANRLLVGTEIVQFVEATALGGSRWRLDGLLRGRGGTEKQAQQGHLPDTLVILLDQALIPVEGLGPAAAAADLFVASGLADSRPVAAALDNPGASLKPLSPIHARRVHLSDGSVRYGWTRRARGAWLWTDGVDVPLVEQGELYLVGTGPLERPTRSWETASPQLVLDAAAYAALPASEPLWVRQIGSHALSDPLLLPVP